MDIFWTVLCVVAVVSFLVLFSSFICFWMAFYVPNRKPVDKNSFDLPPGKIYEPFRDTMVSWMKETRALPHEEVSIVSFDGLTLRGKYYEYSPDAPIELMLHGYRGTSERDLCGGVQRCFALERNVLIVDLRACGNSEGHVISFGVNESRDCLDWIAFILKRFGPQSRIILTGISMGASTVMMTAAKPLPPNVIGILADCGYSSARDIIQKVIRQLKLPASLLYPFVKLGARLYGGFDLEETPPVKAMENCPVPVIFVHGENDDFVPCEMSHQNYEACTAPKILLTVPGAGHGLAYLVDQQKYLETVTSFSEQYY